MENWLLGLKQKISTQISQNKNTKMLVSELEKIRKELKTKSTELNTYLNSEKDKTVKSAEGKYHSLLKQVSTTQKLLDKEVKKALSQIKDSAKKVEKTFFTTKKKATGKTRSRTSTKKTSAKATATKKMDKSTTKKAAARKSSPVKSTKAAAK
ncbi:MAG: hypothetical protein J0M15_11385 [Deltaproteobacteria bacterium]|jgi:hypothetical protein|nr:hypothetical protein [Deltaproteobacteria bacterium]